MNNEIEISVNDDITTEIENLAEFWHEKYETSKNVRCCFNKFHILAKEKGKIIGILIGYTAFSEIYVNDLIVSEVYRGNGIGRELLSKLEQHFEGRNFSNINLVTNKFQASEFYKKCGYNLEFVRENKRFPLFSKYFFIKWLN